MNVRDRIDIPMETLAELCRRYHVRDDFSDDSDIDVLVDYEPDASVGLYEHVDLQMELEQLLGRKIDLVSKRGLNVVIRDDVLLTSQVLYAA